MIKIHLNKVNGFFKEGHERTLKAKKNIVASLFLKGITVMIGLLLVPMTIHYVNPVQYGIWLTLGSIIAWFNFFDIGLANGLKNKIAEANAHGETENIKSFISTTYAILTGISVSIFLLFLICNFFLDWSSILNAKNIQGCNLNTIALIVFGAFCVQFVVQIISSVLAAFHDMSKTSLIYAIGQFGSLIGIYILTKFTTGSLLYLVILLTVFPLLVQIVASVWYFKTKYAQYAPNYKTVHIAYAKSLLSIGGAFFFVQIGSLLLFQTDNIVVSQLLGPQEVTVFNISYKLFSIISMVFTIIMNPFWPAFTDAYEKNDIAWIKSIFRQVYKYFFILTGVSFIMLLISPFIFKIWLGASVAIPFMLSFVMTLYVIGICWMTIHCYFINGIGKIRMQLYLYIVSTIINIPLAIVLGKYMGVIGVTISNLVILVMMGVVLYIQCNKILADKAKGIWNL
ncbi:oligosaccharide flippase family protein [uncultured Mucilaginibacter sp.]|uniref:lipopolysaccharide biosynthesis protein n=1 Tax=uncultured Mucilaginibacter sp. TaxID=797541 RepID=UPI0026005C4D|nr:oligosaccharide flippase family protein [uncultured Mucilaginibacter sp.]